MTSLFSRSHAPAAKTGMPNLLLVDLSIELRSSPQQACLDQVVGQRLQSVAIESKNRHINRCGQECSAAVLWL